MRPFLMVGCGSEEKRKYKLTTIGRSTVYLHGVCYLIENTRKCKKMQENSCLNKRER